MSDFTKQCVDFERTHRAVMLEKRGLLEFELLLRVPPDLINPLGSALGRALTSGDISETDRKTLSMVAKAKVRKFESDMSGLIGDQGSYALMEVERSTLEEFLVFLFFESVSRRLNDERGKDYAALEEDQEE